MKDMRETRLLGWFIYICMKCVIYEYMGVTGWCGTRVKARKVEWSKKMFQTK